MGRKGGLGERTLPATARLGIAGATTAKRGGATYGSCPTPAAETEGSTDPLGKELLVVADVAVTGHTVPPVAGKPVPESVDKDSEAPDPAVEGDAMRSAIAMGNNQVYVVLFTGFLSHTQFAHATWALGVSSTSLKSPTY